MAGKLKTAKLKTAKLKTVGVDVGGTFTDLILLDRESGEIRVAKLPTTTDNQRSEEHTSELQSRRNLVCRLLLDKKNRTMLINLHYTFICETGYDAFEHAVFVSP